MASESEQMLITANSPYGALTFDCYGTLIDWEAGILAFLRPWAVQNRLMQSDEDLLRAFAAVEHHVQSAHPSLPYSETLRLVGHAIGDRLGAKVSTDEARRLAASVGEWRPFPDTVDALRRLKARHRLIIVSNVDAASFAGSDLQLGIEFDAVVTAEKVGAYKPDLRMFHTALEQAACLGVPPEQVLHVAQSLFHDHVPAKSLGLRTAWINRRRDRKRGEPSGATPAPSILVTPDLEFATLAELADRLDQSAAGGVIGLETGRAGPM